MSFWNEEAPSILPMAELHRRPEHFRGAKRKGESDLTIMNNSRCGAVTL